MCKLPTRKRVNRRQCMTRRLCNSTRALEAVPVYGLAGSTSFSADVSFSKKIIVCKGRQLHSTVPFTSGCGTRSSPDPHLYPKEGKLVLLLLVLLLMQLVLIPRL